MNAKGEKKTDEYEIFNNSLKKVLSASPSEIRDKIAAEKKHRKASSRASREKH